MLCEVCKKNDATVYITKITNGKKQQYNLCENCAKEFDGLSLGGEMGIISPFSFQNILSGLMEYMGEVPETTKGSNIACKNCGMTLRDFKEKGILGCSECYKVFAPTVNPVINRVQGKVDHIGKIPRRCGKGIVERKKMVNLKQELQKAIAMEEYEKAAEIRDKIREITNENNEID